VTTVRDPGTMSMEEVHRLIGQLVFAAEAHRLRMAELEAAVTATPPNGHVPAPVESATPAES
jgi:hypothetical protein